DHNSFRKRWMTVTEAPTSPTPAPAPPACSRHSGPRNPGKSPAKRPSYRCCPSWPPRVRRWRLGRWSPNKGCTYPISGRSALRVAETCREFKPQGPTMAYGLFKMIPMVTEPGVDRSLPEWDTGLTNFGYIDDERFPELPLKA